MSEYALIKLADNSIIEFRDLPTVPPDVTHKGLKWLPVAVTNPNPTETQIKEGPIITVEAERVTRVWTLRDKTVQEIDNEKEEYLTGLEKLGFQIDFDHENRLRALEGSQPVTAAQFRNALKARL